MTKLWEKFGRILGRRYHQLSASEQQQEARRARNHDPAIQRRRHREQQEMAERLREVADRLQAEMDVFRRDPRNGTPRTSH